MTSCKHINLVLLPKKKNMLRCQHCHLTISPDELGNGHCPECFEINGKKKYDFEEIVAEETDIATYRCEDCGLIIESEK